MTQGLASIWRHQTHAEHKENVVSKCTNI